MGERIRSEGQSGLKRTRVNNLGTRNYHSETTNSATRTAAVHDHSDHYKTVGVGEFIAVMNGNEFRTRHNDYLLKKPSKTSTGYHETEDIEYPTVPSNVTDKATVAEQIDEMREWFSAFQRGSTSPRDYTQHFKPLLCYLEGTWLSGQNLEEPFDSDRHFVDAQNWFDLQEKIRFTSYSGSKDRFENYAYLPTSIFGMSNESDPILAQWNYRILCHPLTRSLRIDRFRVIDEVHARMRKKLTLEDFEKTRAARFQLNPADSNTFKEGFDNYELLDELMEEVPGMNNYPADLTDEAFGVETYHYNKGNQRLNSGYYHRSYQAKVADAMGTTTRRRGYNDPTVFMAMTNNSEVSGMTVDECAGEATPCNRHQKWTYAIPLEIIYLTPLHAWNPYNILYKGDKKSTEGLTVVGSNNERNGGFDTSTAFDGTNSNNFYRTPAEFYLDGSVSPDPADTASDSVGVLDQDGNVREVSPSGVRVLTPDIPGVGVVRTRWPIYPVHGEGSSVWKTLNALKDIVLRPLSMASFFTENPTKSAGGDSSNSDVAVNFKLKPSDATHGNHEHELSITDSERETLMGGGQVSGKKTTEGNAHSHTLTLQYVAASGDTPEYYKYVQCDVGAVGEPCGDNHSVVLRTL